MPKYGIHHIVIKEAMSVLNASENDAASNAAEIIQAEMPSAIIGSIGPDLFFWGPDYEIVETLKILYDNINYVVDLYNQIVEPIRAIGNAIGEPIEALVETLAPSTIALIRYLLNQIEQTATYFKSAIGTELFAGIIEGANLLTDAAGIGPLAHQFFQQFVPDLQYNYDEENWYWFDMLHYRNTGSFAQNLVNEATTPKQKAFAYGYLSHIATDVTGHPFVNQIVGTVYRLNVQRHVTAENFMDSWKYAQYYRQNDETIGESINRTLFTRLMLPENLPSDIGDLLFNAFRKTYDENSVPHPNLYTRDQIDETYRVFYDVLELIEGWGVDRPEEPFSGANDILSEALERFSPPPDPPSTSSACSLSDIFSFGFTERSRECYKNFFEEIENWLNYLGELIKWSLESLRNLIDLILSLLLSLPICILLALLYGIQLLCYQIYRSARMVLATSGFVMPEPDELNNSIARNLITLFQPCGWSFKNFPSRGTPVTSHLVCPTLYTERPNTAPGFYLHGIESTVNRFIIEQEFNEVNLRRYALSENPQQTRDIELENISIGNATLLTAWMIQNANDPVLKEIVFANWNLDADRGYGYLTWSGIVPHDEPFFIERERYT